MIHPIRAYRDGGRKYFWHNMICESNLLWALQYCLFKDGRIRDFWQAFVPAKAKAMRKGAVDQMLSDNADMVAVINEHSDVTFGESTNHFLGECEGRVGGCAICDQEFRTHFGEGTCPEDCPLCEAIANGYEYDVMTGFWQKASQ